MTIEDFLLERIAEDEAAATAAGNLQFWRYDNEPLGWSLENDGGERILTVDPGTIAVGNYWNHAARHLPARVLAECAAKRAIVERYLENLDRVMAYRNPRWRDAMNDSDRFEHRLQEARCATSLEDCWSLASTYAEHPDYQQEWSG